MNIIFNKLFKFLEAVKEASNSTYDLYKEALIDIHSSKKDCIEYEEENTYILEVSGDGELLLDLLFAKSLEFSAKACKYALSKLKEFAE